MSLGVIDDGHADPLVRAHCINDQIASIDLHDLALGGAFGVKAELDAAKLAIALAVAVAGVNDIVSIFRVQWNQAQTVRNELVCENAAVLLYLDEIDGYGRNFRKYNTTQGVRKAEVNVGQIEVDMVVIGLSVARAG